MATFEVRLGDITKTDDVDAIVNAAHESMLGGGGVDGAIHKAAGPGLLKECSAIPDSTPHESLEGDHRIRCPVGGARLTRGHALPVKFIIHTVAPRFVGAVVGGKYRAANPEVYEQLAACYRNCLRLADDNRIRSLAFPSLGTGGHSFPIELACPVAVDTVREEVARLPSILLVRFVCFSPSDYAAYRRVLAPV